MDERPRASGAANVKPSRPSNRGQGQPMRLMRGAIQATQALPSRRLGMAQEDGTGDENQPAKVRNIQELILDIPSNDW